MADKFAERYGVGRNANQRAYAKRTGGANARLYLIVTEDSEDLYWWPLATEGAGAYTSTSGSACMLCHGASGGYRDFGTDQVIVLELKEKAPYRPTVMVS